VKPKIGETFVGKLSLNIDAGGVNWLVPRSLLAICGDTDIIMNSLGTVSFDPDNIDDNLCLSFDWIWKNSE